MKDEGNKNSFSAIPHDGLKLYILYAECLLICYDGETDSHTSARLDYIPVVVFLSHTCWT